MNDKKYKTVFLDHNEVINRERDTVASAKAGIRVILIKSNESLLYYADIITGK